MAWRAVLLTVVVLVTGCDGGVQEGSVAEFCADWSTVSATAGVVADSSDGLDRLYDELQSVRYPENISATAELALEQYDAVRSDLEGLDMDSDEANRIVDSANMAAGTALGQYADINC